MTFWNLLLSMVYSGLLVIYVAWDQFNTMQPGIFTWTLKWYVNSWSRAMLTKKRSNCKKRVLDSKNAQDFEKCSKCSGDVQTSLVTPQTSSPLCRGKNTLWGIVKCWQAWSSQPNKGVQKPSCSELKKGRFENACGTFFNLRSFARICARFAPSLCAL